LDLASAVASASGAVVFLVPFLLASTEVGGGAVDALLGDDPLLAVALGDTTSDAVQIAAEVALHAGVVSVPAADLEDRVSGGALLVSAGRGAAQFLAGREFFLVLLGETGVVFALGVGHRHVLGGQDLAALIDHAVALDENVGLDVSSVGDLAGASGGIDLADAVVGNAHAGVGAVVVESALGGAVRSGHGVVVSAAHLQVGLELIDGLAGVNHSGEFGLDGHALIISDVHLLHGVAAHAQTTEIRYKGRGTKISRDIFCNYRIFMRFIK